VSNSTTILPPALRDRGWCIRSRSRADRINGPPSAPVTATACNITFGWVGYLHRPVRHLRLLQRSMIEAIEAVEAAEREGPLSNLWLEANGAPCPKAWVHSVSDGHDRWVATAYDYRYVLVVLQLPIGEDGAIGYVAFVNDEPVFEPPDPCDVPENEPGELTLEVFTVFHDPLLAMDAAELTAYNRWIQEPGNTLVTDGLPGQRELDNPDTIEFAIATMMDICRSKQRLITTFDGICRLSRRDPVPPRPVPLNTHALLPTLRAQAAGAAIEALAFVAGNNAVTMLEWMRLKWGEDTDIRDPGHPARVAARDPSSPSWKLAEAVDALAAVGATAPQPARTLSRWYGRSSTGSGSRPPITC
jgi:hypothetical protein